MRLPFYAGFFAAIFIAWAPGGLIHRGQRSVAPDARPAIAAEACALAGDDACRQNPRADVEAAR